MLSFIVLMLQLNLFSQVNFCESKLDDYPTQAQGREKPLLILAEDSLRYMTGSKSFEKMTATEVFCRLSLQPFGLPFDKNLQIKVEHIDVKKDLGLSEDGQGINVKELEAKIPILQVKLKEQKENNSYKKELKKVISRFETYEAISSGSAWTVPVENQGKIDFLPLTSFLTESRVQAMGGENPVQSLFEQSKSSYLKLKGDNYLRELTYYKYSPFTYAIFLTLLSLVLYTVISRPIAGHIAASVSVLLQIYGMILRILISGRAPVTNMYETVMFSGLGALIISGVVYFFYRKKAYLLSGLAYNLLCLMMMKFANGMLDEGISPLVPVLRDNFWLSTHVTTIILSYAALALSWLLANGVILRQLVGKISNADAKDQSSQVYLCIKIGVVLLSTGIILGGVWADYSWGRFWGWDPKETWSLIVFLIYMAILHGKYTNWITQKNFIPLVSGAFLSVMMAWFGVNYILASGLHSYGFSEGGAIFLGLFFVIQISLLVVHQMKIRRGEA